jgi:hypothetical protein
MFVEPVSDTYHWHGEFPGRQFSASIAFLGALHEANAENRKLTFKQVGACIPKPGEFLNSAPQNLPSRPDRNCKLVEAGESGLIAMPAGSLAENCPFGRCF